MAQLQAQVQGLTLTNAGTHGRTPLTPILGQATNSDINPRTGKPWKRYCWTCGCCPHWSRNCPKKAKGHKDNATFKNRMGGSNANCL